MKRGQSFLFDLIVLDLNMPISNGYEACKNILMKYDNSRILKIATSKHISRKKPINKG